MRSAEVNTSSTGALNQRSTLLRMSSLPTSRTSTAGINVMPRRTATSFPRKRANGRARRRSTISLMTLRASTNARPSRIVRSATQSPYRTNSVRKSGDSPAERFASATMPTRAASRTIMPARMSRGLSRSGRRGGAIFSSFFRVQQILELRHELADVAEMSVDRCESHIGDLVELLQLFHDERADLVGADFLLGAFLQGALDAIGDRLERGHTDRPLFTSLQQAGDELLPLEPFAAAIFLHHHVRNFIDPFVARESLAAAEAFAA